MEDDDSDMESVQSEEFEEMISKMSGVNEDEDDIDFINEIGDSLKNTNQKKSEYYIIITLPDTNYNFIEKSKNEDEQNESEDDNLSEDNSDEDTDEGGSNEELSDLENPEDEGMNMYHYPYRL